MKLIVRDDYDAMCAFAAGVIAHRVSTGEHFVAAWPTGSTPQGVYAALAAMQELDMDAVVSYQMDEYAGLDRDHPQSFYAYLKRELYDRFPGMEARANWFFDDPAAPPGEVGRRYDERIARDGGLDFLLLGIGSDGHIAFNMPGPRFAVGCGYTALSAQTIRDNARFFAREEDVPTRAITLGMGTILRTRQVLLMASGTGKAEAVRRLLELEECDPGLPASILHLHPDAAVLVDREIADHIEGVVRG